VLFVNDADTARTGDDLLDFNYSAVGRGRAKIPAFHVKRSVLEAMLHSELLYTHSSGLTDTKRT